MPDTSSHDSGSPRPPQAASRVRHHDAIVIGGGPAGAAAGAFLARHGHDVALFEKERFPRFHIGESLIPACNLTLERLGLLTRMVDAGFPSKHGVQFFSTKGPSKPFYFDEVEDPRLHQTWQVRRSEFDRMMIERAVCCGVVPATDTRVLGVIEEPGDDGRPAVRGVRVERADGRREEVRARVVLDASGQQGLLAKSHGGRENVRGLENASVFAHYRGVHLDAGRDAGSTLIFRIDQTAWIWLIPLPDAVSIGLVTRAGRIAEFGGNPTEILDEAIRRCEHIQPRLRGAARVSEVRAARDFSYRATRDGGRGWALVGDALGFIDPMYSTGLFLSLRSAELAADAAARALADGGATPDLTGYSADWQQAFDRFLVLVRAFYADGFGFGEFSREAANRQGLVDLLTGVVDSPAAVRVAAALAVSCPAAVA